MTLAPRLLGTTGRTVSRLGLGLAALGRPEYINLGHAGDLAGHRSVAALERRAHAVLDAATEAGVRYVDAARSYGRAEPFLASWLRDRKMAAGTLTIGTKWGYTYTAGWRAEAEQHEVKDHSLATLERQLAESRALLGEHLDLLQIHSVTPESPVLRDGGVLARLREARGEGLLIGLSVSGPGQPTTIRHALDLGVFDTVQATWNLLEPSAGEALREAHAAGVGVIVKEALANGRLTGRGDVDAVASLAAARGVALDALALAAVLAQPWADVVLSGAATVEQLGSNLGAVDVGWDDEADEATRVLVEEPRAYWQRRAALPWN